MQLNNGVADEGGTSQLLWLLLNAIMFFSVAYGIVIERGACQEVVKLDVMRVYESRTNSVTM